MFNSPKMNNLTIGVWNADGLVYHQLELFTWMDEHKVDIMLISESHLTSRSFLKFNGFPIYAANQALLVPALLLNQELHITLLYSIALTLDRLLVLRFIVILGIMSLLPFTFALLFTRTYFHYWN